MVAPPHVPDDVRYTHDEFVLYRAGYDWALLMALRALELATRRHALVVKTQRLEAKRRREAQP